MEKVDYIIVGVGTAGAVVCKELTDDKKTSVIALHSGENLTEDPLIKYSRNAIITVLSALIGPPLYEKGESTEQVYDDCRKLLWDLSVPEGGASSVNAGAWCRGTNAFYSRWEALSGPEWSVDGVLEIYKSLEKYQGNTPNPIFRGYHGPVDVRQVPKPGQVAHTFTEAISTALNVPVVVDYNDPKTPIGSSAQFQYTQKGCNGALRVSSATAFLNEKVMTPDGKGVHGRKLLVKFNSKALRILWRGNTAIGVEYLVDGKVKRVYAKKGVISCAGLYSTPLLLHSGVGSKQMLEELGIKVKFDNPNVGQNLVDQWMVLMGFASKVEDTPLVNNNSLFTQISWLPAPNGDPNIRKLRLATLNLFPGFTAMLMDLLQPKSQGQITIDSANPLDPPVIDFKIFSNPADLNLYVEAFQQYITKINATLQAQYPGYGLVFPDTETINNREALTAYIKQMVRSNQSFQGHCQMAPFDKGGVVDSLGRVYGVKNLYVADDSVVPYGMDGSSMATAFLVAANIVRLLKATC